MRPIVRKNKLKTQFCVCICCYVNAAAVADDDEIFNNV